MLQIIVNRIKELMTHEGYQNRVKAFAEHIQINERTLRNYLADATKEDGTPNKNYRDISLETVIAIAIAFPNLNCNWLLRGEEPMFIEQHDEHNYPSLLSEGFRDTHPTSPSEIYRDLYEQKNRECLDLAKQLGKLEATLELRSNSH